MEEIDITPRGETSEPDPMDEVVISEDSIEETQPSTTTEAPDPESPTPPEPKPPLPKEESRIVKALRRALRWTVGVADIFAAGVLLMFFVTYLPVRNDLNATKQELQDAQQQIEDLLVLQEENQNLKDLLNEANLRRYLNTAQADVSMARIALMGESPDAADAHLQLNNFSQTLNSLANLLDDNQKEIITSLEQRYQLALDELEEDPGTAASDLKVIYDKLIELENSLFSDP
jgi:hypothetical protein